MEFQERNSTRVPSSIGGLFRNQLKQPRGCSSLIATAVAEKFGTFKAFVRYCGSRQKEELIVSAFNLVSTCTDAILQTELAAIRKEGGDRLGRSAAITLWRLFYETF